MHEPTRVNRQSLRDLRIADLELFITAAHLHSLSQAATIHHISQSAASSAIQRVEIAFGVMLCTHEKRHFRLTHDGRCFLPKAEQWLTLLREKVAVIDPPPIRIATTHAIARAAIPPVLSFEKIDLTLMRPDSAYGAVLRDEADIAIVLDNSAWEGVIISEIGKGAFQLYSKDEFSPIGPVLIPEDQIEVLTLQQRWQQLYHQPLSVKARLPSWSLIADICQFSIHERGFLPDFLGTKVGLHPVSWQPMPSKYRVLALSKKFGGSYQARFDALIMEWKKAFE